MFKSLCISSALCVLFVVATIVIFPREAPLEVEITFTTGETLTAVYTAHPSQLILEDGCFIVRHQAAKFCGVRSFKIIKELK